MKMSRLAPWALVLIGSFAGAHAGATAAMDLVDRTTLNGTWEGFDAVNGHLVLLRVHAAKPAILVLIDAAMPNQPSYRFEIENPRLGADGVVDMVGTDRAKGLRISAKGKGRAAETIGVMSLRFEWLKSRNIIAELPFDLDVTRTPPTLAREMAKAELLAVQRIEENK